MELSSIGLVGLLDNFAISTVFLVQVSANQDSFRGSLANHSHAGVVAFRCIRQLRQICRSECFKQALRRHHGQQTSWNFSLDAPCLAPTYHGSKPLDHKNPFLYKCSMRFSNFHHGLWAKLSSTTSHCKLCPPVISWGYQQTRGSTDDSVCRLIIILIISSSSSSIIITIIMKIIIIIIIININVVMDSSTFILMTGAKTAFFFGHAVKASWNEVNLYHGWNSEAVWPLRPSGQLESFLAFSLNQLFWV